MAETGVGSVLMDSGLGTNHFDAPGLVLDERTGMGLTTFRARPTAISLPPGWPREVGGVVGNDPLLCCLRPGEWLRLSGARPDEEPGPDALLRIDRSHALAVLRVGGSLAPWLLAQLSALDFFALVTANENACTQARISHARVIVITRSAVDPHGPGFELLVDRSLARDLWERLLAAAPHAARMSQLAGA